MTVYFQWPYTSNDLILTTVVYFEPTYTFNELKLSMTVYFTFPSSKYLCNTSYHNFQIFLIHWFDCWQCWQIQSCFQLQSMAIWQRLISTTRKWLKDSCWNTNSLFTVPSCGSNSEKKLRNFSEKNQPKAHQVFTVFSKMPSIWPTSSQQLVQKGR